MRISDWSSDVCSSDLGHRARARSVEDDGGAAALHSRQCAFGEARRGGSGRRGLRARPGNLRQWKIGGRAPHSRRQGATDEMVERLRSEEHTSELQSLMRISYAVFCLQKKTNTHINNKIIQ